MVLASSAAARRFRGGWNVEGRILVEESKRLQLETAARYRLHRKILGSRQMMVPERVPDRDLRVGDWPIGLRPRRQAISVGTLVDIVAGWPTLLVAGRRHPQVMADEARPPRNLRARFVHGLDGAFRHQTV